MSAATPLRIGQTNGAGATDALFLKVFGGGERLRGLERNGRILLDDFAKAPVLNLDPQRVRPQEEDDLRRGAEAGAAPVEPRRALRGRVGARQCPCRA